MTIIPYLFYPLLASGIALLCSFIFFAIASKKEKCVFVAKILCISVFFASIATILVCFSIYYHRETTNSSINNAMLWVSAVILVVIIALLGWLFGRKTSPTSETKSIAYASVCIALAFALSFVRLFRLPQGGSITLVSLLPLFIYSQMFGVRKGIIAGVIYGILQAIQDPWILHPAQFMLDYPIAFATVGISAIFSQNGIKGKKGIGFFALGTVISGIIRYACHVLSGIFAFAEYVGEGYTLLGWSFAYNSFSLVDMAITLIVGVAVLFNSAFRNIVNKNAFISLENKANNNPQTNN